MIVTVEQSATDDAILGILSIERARAACLFTSNKFDEKVKDYLRAAFDELQDLSRCSLLPRQMSITARIPVGRIDDFHFRTGDTSYKSVRNSSNWIDVDGVKDRFRVPQGPVISVDSIVYLKTDGTDGEVIDTGHYSLVSERFLTWTPGFVFQRTTSMPYEFFKVKYTAGFGAQHPKRAAMKIALEELLAAKYDAKGGKYALPTTTSQFVASVRTSRTYQ